ncbi:hypothetical protein ACLB2K_072473 [Fragaria x ananassa]
MYSHLTLYCIRSSYTVWTWHGETQVQMPTLVEIQAQHNQQAGSSNSSYGDPAVMNLLNDVFPFAASGYQENDVYDNVPDTSHNVSHVDYSSDYDNAYLNDEDRVGESSGAGSSQQFNISVVSNDVQPYGRLSNSERLSNAEIKEAHWSVLQHCDEEKRY